MNFSSFAWFNIVPQKMANFSCFWENLTVVYKDSLMFYRDAIDFFLNWRTFVKILKIWSDHLFPQYFPGWGSGVGRRL